MPETPVIEVLDVRKRYGSRSAAVLAVDGVSLRVGRGEIYGFLGLNGAGKTTTIRMLLGMVRPTSGSVALLGHPVSPRAEELWARVGYLVETPHAYPELTVRQNLELLRRLRGSRGALPSSAVAEAVAEAIERLGLSAYADRRAGTLSLGNAQRLGLAKALMHDPEIVILDEPANGLDPAGVVEVRTLLRELAGRGVTVFLSSHILGEVARLATRIGIVHRGRLMREADTTDLTDEQPARLVLAARDLAAAGRVLRGAALTPERDGDRLALTDARSVQRPDDVATLLVRAGCPPTSLAIERDDLETYFLRLIGEEPADA